MALEAASSRVETDMRSGRPATRSSSQQPRNLLYYQREDTRRAKECPPITFCLIIYLFPSSPPPDPAARPFSPPGRRPREGRTKLAPVPCTLPSPLLGPCQYLCVLDTRGIPVIHCIALNGGWHALWRRLCRPVSCAVPQSAGWLSSTAVCKICEGG